jgi:hypothetical protein
MLQRWPSMLRVFVFDERIRLSCVWKGGLQLRLRLCLPSTGQRFEADSKAAKPSSISATLLRLMRPADARWPGLLAPEPSLGYAHPNVRPITEDLACDEPGISRFSARIWKRLHIVNCLERWDSPVHRLCRLICVLLPRAWRPCGCRTVWS